MAITKATVQLARALWVELAPVFQADLDEVHLALEKQTDSVKIAWLQARATTLRAFLKIPHDLEKKLGLEELQAAAEEKR